MQNIRLPHVANTRLEVVQYFNTRDRQLRANGIYIDPSSFKWYQEGCTVEVKKGQTTYYSFYVYNQYRGLGVTKRLIEKVLGCNESAAVLTVKDCNVHSWLTRNNIPVVLEQGVFDTQPYKLVERIYSDRVAQRSQVFLMNHIDEGIQIGRIIGATDAAIKSYCLHPMLQADLELVTYMPTVLQPEIDRLELLLAMEYRNKANAWLSDKVSTVDGITTYDGAPTPGPLPEVRDMLVMDKVQNYKDFLLYHSNHHRAIELDAYFKRWFVALGLTFNEVTDIIDQISLSEWDFETIIT